MRRWRAVALAGVLAVLPSGCREEAMAVEASDVRVEAGEDHLVVTNGRHEPIFWFAIYEDVAAVIEWEPCTTAGCQSVGPQTITRVPYAQVAGGSGRVVLFYWWTAELLGENTPGAGAVRMLRVER